MCLEVWWATVSATMTANTLHIFLFSRKWPYHICSIYGQCYHLFYVSWVMWHVSCAMSHLSSTMCNMSNIMQYVLYVMCNMSCAMGYMLWFVLCHVSSLMYHMSCGVCHVMSGCHISSVSGQCTYSHTIRLDWSSVTPFDPWPKNH